MKKTICFLMALAMTCLLVPGAGLADALQLAQPLTGQYAYPEGSTAENAEFMFTYSYPQIEPQQETDANINTYYSDVLEEMVNFTVPMYAQSGDGANSDVPMYMNVNFEVTANNDDYFSAVVTKEQFIGVSISQTLEACTFARKGDYAGGVVSLPAVLGILEEDEMAATAAIDTVYELVWQIITEQIQAGTVDYFEELTEEDLFAEFYPETDFYLDQSGNLVFFIQPSMVASNAAGLLTFPFSPAEILGEMPQ